MYFVIEHDEHTDPTVYIYIERETAIEKFKGFVSYFAENYSTPDEFQEDLEGAVDDQCYAGWGTSIYFGKVKNMETILSRPKKNLETVTRFDVKLLDVNP